MKLKLLALAYAFVSATTAYYLWIVQPSGDTNQAMWWTAIVGGLLSLPWSIAASVFQGSPRGWISVGMLVNAGLWFYIAANAERKNR